MAEVAKEPSRTTVRTVGFLVAIVFFFIITLLVSFFGIIVLIDEMDIPGDMAPNVFMVGLIPPSILSFLLYTKLFGRFI
ncbi:MAG TPA: hypothetical protein VGQ03_09450 [Nitrososphaera sp.]|jgi:hypothetical protein|nr:hypothetical protein [Nitrososphaera sp.]